METSHQVVPRQHNGVRDAGMGWTLVSLAACSAAWRPDAARPAFDLDVPEGWVVTRNHRLLWNREFALVAPDGRASITLQLVRETAATRAVPLDLLVEVRAIGRARGFGVENTVSRIDAIVLDDREAWVATGHSRWHAAAGAYSLVALRAGPNVAFVTLIAPDGELDAALGPWSGVLDSLVFPAWPVPADAPVFQDDPI
jgi:hypothetical protein